MSMEETILDILFENYNANTICVSKTDDKELYCRMNGKSLNESSKIIYNFCILCRDYEMAGFLAGIKKE